MVVTDRLHCTRIIYDSVLWRINAAMHIVQFNCTGYGKSFPRIVACMLWMIWWQINHLMHLIFNIYISNHPRSLHLAPDLVLKYVYRVIWTVYLCDYPSLTTCVYKKMRNVEKGVHKPTTRVSVLAIQARPMAAYSPLVPVSVSMSVCDIWDIWRGLTAS